MKGDAMRAFTLDSFDSAPRLRDDLPEPRPAGRELLVRVHASSVNPADAAIAAGVLKEMVEHDFPVTLGRDFAGTVEKTGDTVSRYQPGDEVYGFLLHANPTVHDGSWAELITIPEDNFLAAKPESLDLANAAVTPLAAITALAARDALAPITGETILVIGATGGVGSFFVQLATRAGAHVIAPALPEDERYLRDLGVTEIIDRNADLETTVRQRHPDGVDAILDLVNFTPQEALLKGSGRLASPLGAAGKGAQRFNLMAQPTPENLHSLAELFDNGTLRVPIQRTYEFAQANDALNDLANKHTQGKLALTTDRGSVRRSV
jgi:NADPH:quinone reductase-like Zn-dependent oxidoreductase